MQSEAVLLMLLWVLGNPKAKPQGWWPVPHSWYTLQRYVCRGGSLCFPPLQAWRKCRFSAQPDFSQRADGQRRQCDHGKRIPTPLSGPAARFREPTCVPGEDAWTPLDPCGLVPQISMITHGLLLLLLKGWLGSPLDFASHVQFSTLQFCASSVMTDQLSALRSCSLNFQNSWAAGMAANMQERKDLPLWNSHTSPEVPWWPLSNGSPSGKVPTAAFPLPPLARFL